MFSKASPDTIIFHDTGCCLLYTSRCVEETGQELGNARLYDLCVNTSDYGLERTVELILEAINTRNEQSLSLIHI